MKTLADWFERQARRERRVRYLEDALLTDRFWPYAWYRLRYFFARYLTAAFIQAVKFLFLYQIFSRNVFVALVVANAAAGFASSFWWGALEELRVRVRRLYRSGRPHAISGEISRWLTFASLVAIFLLLMAVGLLAGILARAPQPTERFTAAHLYALSILLRLSLDVVSRTFHSGVYAIRRIYRPVGVIVGLELVALASVLALWPWLGEWSFPLAMIAASVTIAAMTIHYTRRAYRFAGIEIPRFFDPGLVRLSPPGSLSEFLGAGGSYAAMKMDAVLVLGLFAVSSGARDGLGLFVLFFILSPTLQAGFDWAQLFYFDLKRLEVTPFRNLRERYERCVHKLAWILGFVFWGLASLTGLLAYRQGAAATIYGLLLPFFLSRSMLAWVQTRAFSHRRYLNLLGSALGWLMGFWTIAVAFSDERARLVALSAVTFATFAWLWRRNRLRVDDGLSGEPLSPLAWMARVRCIRQAGRIRWLDLAPYQEARAGRASADRLAWARRQIVIRIARRLGDAGAVTVRGARRIVWYERAGRPAFSDAWLIRLGSGAVEKLGRADVARDGASALVNAAPSLFGNEWPADPAGITPSPEEMRRQFLRTFPEGVVCSPGERARGILAVLSSRECRAILVEAMRFARDLRPTGSRSRFDISALCEGDEVRLIFLLEKRADSRARARWRALVRRVNLQMALREVGGPQRGSYVGARELAEV